MKKLIAALALTTLLTSSSFGQFKTGQQAPDFTLNDLDGNHVTLSEVVGGGPVYINFWATWCGPCKKEIPELIKLYDQFKDRGFKVLAISVDDSRTQGKVKSFVADRNMPFTILLDGNSEVFKRKYKGTGIPYGFLLDNEGKIVHSVRGYIPGMEKTLEAKIQPYLAAAPEPAPKGDQSADKGSGKKAPSKKDETVK